MTQWAAHITIGLERSTIEEAMKRARGIQTEAARLLGISRCTLQYRLEIRESPARLSRQGD